MNDREIYQILKDHNDHGRPFSWREKYALGRIIGARHVGLSEKRLQMLADLHTYPGVGDTVNQRLDRLEKNSRLLGAWLKWQRDRRLYDLQQTNHWPTKVIQGDSRLVLPTLASASHVACVTDPPFGIDYKQYHDQEDVADNPKDYWSWFQPIYQEIHRIVMRGMIESCG